MSPRCLAWSLSVCLLAGEALLPVAGAMKVAILAEESPDLEALLVAKLGQTKDLEVLSRSDLPALAREAGDFARTGSLHLAGADRLVMLNKSTDGLMARVADCATGALLYQGTVSAKLEPAALADLLSLRLPRYLQEPLQPDARRIALQGFRFASSSEETRAMEARLNLACALALQSSGRAVVLERWRMKDLVFENSLREAAVGPFWSAASLVDGSIVQDGERLTVRLEVKNPASKEKRTETVEGKSADVPELGRRVAAAILTGAALPAGTAQAEAQDYLAETRWLMDHSLATEAAQAAEAAAALDPGDQQAQILRIRAYARGAYPDDLTIRLYHGAPGYGGAIHAESVAVAVAMATEMSRLVEDYVMRYPPLDKEDLADPVTLGLRAMHTCLCVLQAAYDYDYFLRAPAAVEELRASTQRNAALLHSKATAIARNNLDLYLVDYAAYRAASPAEAIAIYRDALRRDAPMGFPGSKGWPTAIRHSLEATIGRNPPLLDVDPTNRSTARPERVLCRVLSWKPDGQKEARSLWEAYVNELAASDDLLQKADGLYFRWGSQALDSNREKSLSEILGFLEAHPDCLMGPDGRAIAQTLTAPMNSLSYVRDGKLVRRYIDLLVRWFSQEALLPYELVGAIGQDFAYRQGDATLPQEMARLEEAMAGQLQRVQRGGDQFYVGVLKGALGSLRGKFPPPASETKKPDGNEATPLVVKRLWLWKEHAQNAPREGLDGSSGAWHDGQIWFAEYNRIGFWKIDPASFRGEFLQGEKPPAHLRGLNGDCRPLFSDGRIYVSSGTGVWSFDLAKKTWHGLDVPVANYVLYEANDALWAFFGNGPWLKTDSATDQGTGLYRINTKADTADLIFSTRRRPAEHPLDSEEIAMPLALFSGTNGQPVLGLSGKVKKFVQLSDGALWTQAVAPRLWERNCRAEGTLLSLRLNFQTGARRPPLLEGVVGVNAKGSTELLLLDPRVETKADPPLPGKPVWEIPESLNAYPEMSNRYYVPATAGDRLYVLIYDVAASAELTTCAELYIFQRGKPDAVRLPLQFAMGEAERQKILAWHRDPEKDIHPRPSLIAGEKGLLMTCPDGFWFIPMEDVNRALAQAPAPAK